MLELDDFTDDKPWVPGGPEFEELRIPDQIAGVALRRLTPMRDGRGDLTVLMTDRLGEAWRTPHVYLVTAAPRSVRAWVYHKRQTDRLAYTMGQFRVVLYDLRPDSATYRQLNVLEVGADNRVLLTIPPFVVHGVQNLGDAPAQFTNMPTRAYDQAHPDKSRVAADHPGIPYRFE